MINRARFTCLCATMIFLSQTVSAISSEVILNTAEEVEGYLYETIKNVQTSVDEISQIPSHEQTFENTLKAWHRLASQLKATSNTLTSIENPAAVQDWYSFINSTVFQNAELSDALMAYAQNPSDEKKLNPYEQHALQHFLTTSYQNAEPAYAYLTGLAKNKQSHSENLTLLNLNASSKEKISLEDMIEKILDANADVVCIQEIIEIDSSYAFYDSLKENYAHFYTTIDMHGFSQDTPTTAKGLFIASKYPIENPKFTAFSNKCGFIDFGLKSGDTLLGHMYAAQLAPTGSPESSQVKMLELEQILAAMVSEYQENIPFLLCGDLGIDEAGSASQELVKTYFTYNPVESSNTNTLLLRPGAARNTNLQIETSSVSISNNHLALLSSIKEPKAVIPEYSHVLASHRPARMFQSNKGYIILCEANEGNDNNRGEENERMERNNDRDERERERPKLNLSLGGGKDSQGNEEVHARIGYVSPNGPSATITSELKRDPNGNISHSTELGISIQIGGK